MAGRLDYYEVLGVARDSDDRTIKSAYRKLALKYHPDRNPGDEQAERRFREAAEAYEVLSDPQKRSLYDRGGHEALEGRGFSGFQGDIGDIFANFGDIFAEFFGGAAAGGFGGGGFRGGPRPMVGADLRYDLELDLQEAFTGTQRTIQLQRMATCEACSGSGAEGGQLTVCAACGGQGQVVQRRGAFMLATPCRACGGAGRRAESVCPSCDGEGHVQTERKLEVQVPAGIADGQKLRVQNEGHGGAHGGPPGDLYVFISVRSHPVFVRAGADLHCELAVDFPTACLGGSAEIPKLVEGEHTVEIPAGMQPGDKVRVRGGGMPQLGGRPPGDLIVHLNVDIPRSLDGDQVQQVEALRNTLGKAPSVSASGPERRETKNRKRRGGSILDRIRDALEGE